MTDWEVKASESSVITLKNNFAFLLLLFHAEALGLCFPAEALGGSWLFIP